MSTFLIESLEFLSTLRELIFCCLSSSDKARSQRSSLSGHSLHLWWGRPDLNRRPFPGNSAFTPSLRVSLTAPELLHPSVVSKPVCFFWSPSSCLPRLRPLYQHSRSTNRTEYMRYSFSKCDILQCFSGPII